VGNIDLLCELVNAGSSVDMPDIESNLTPLARAIEQGNEEATGVLLGRGADFSSISDLLKKAVEKFSKTILDRIDVSLIQYELSAPAGCSLFPSGPSCETFGHYLSSASYQIPVAKDSRRRRKGFTDSHL
jgi:hypothetical protein